MIMIRTRLISLLIAAMMALCTYGAAKAATLEEAVDTARGLVDAEGPDAAQKAAQAREMLEQAIKEHSVDVNVPPARLLLARANHEQGRYFDAAEVLLLLEEEKPANISQNDVLVALVYALNGKGDYFGALERAQFLLKAEDFKEDPRRPEIIYEGAWHYETVLRRPLAAAEYFARLAKEHPKHERAPAAAVRAGYLYEHQVKDLRSAVQAYLDAAIAYPKHKGDPLLNWQAAGGWGAGWRAINIAGMLNNYIHNKYGLCDFKLQAEVCEELARVFPAKRDKLYTHMMNSAALAYSAGYSPRGQAKRGDTKAAVQWARKALEANPKHVEVLNFLISYGEESKRPAYVGRYFAAGGSHSDPNHLYTTYGNKLTALAHVNEALKFVPKQSMLLYKGMMLALDADDIRERARNRRDVLAKKHRAEAAKLNQQMKDADVLKKKLDTEATAKDQAAAKAEGDEAKKLRDEAAKLRKQAGETWTERERFRSDATTQTNLANNQESYANNDIE